MSENPLRRLALGDRPSIGAVLIGRNEGDRLVRSLASLQGQVDTIVYVDSGSTDSSLAEATSAGALIVELDTSVPFTAARARNAGFDLLMSADTPPDLVQFMDGDCELQPTWLEAAKAHLKAHPNVAVVCGRRRERYPENSVYNWLIDREWDTPIGEARACGGDALMRTDALKEVGAYNPTLIAGEEPEMCVRLRQAGWKIWRLDEEMTLHDAALTKFSQWWKRTRRGGHAFAQGSFMHGAPPEGHFARETRSALLWGAALPALILLTALVISPWALLALLIFPLQFLRLARKGYPRAEAGFLTLGKFPEALGALEFHLKRLRGQQSTLIEYK